MLNIMMIGCQSEKTKKERVRCNGLSSTAVKIAWWAHFILLLNLRFSRPGKICSGDFYEMETMEASGYI